MKLTPQITFHGMEASDAVADSVRERIHHLELFCPQIMSCRVTVDLMQKHRQQGRPFGVRIDLTMPGTELVVDRVQNEELAVALREAFDDMKRQVEDAVRRRQGKVKQHRVESPRGRTDDGA